MENYEKTLIDEYERLNAQRQAIMKNMYEIETKLDKIKAEKAATLYNEIRNKMCELEKLGYHFEVQVWNNEDGDYDWYDTTNSPTYRYRHKDTVIVD